MGKGLGAPKGRKKCTVLEKRGKERDAPTEQREGGGTRCKMTRIGRGKGSNREDREEGYKQ